MSLLISSLFVTMKWEQTRCPSAEEGMMDLLHMYNVTLLSVNKRNEIRKMARTGKCLTEGGGLGPDRQILQGLETFLSVITVNGVLMAPLEKKLWILLNIIQCTKWSSSAKIYPVQSIHSVSVEKPGNMGTPGCQRPQGSMSSPGRQTIL